jgi:ElaB/YqjD/DUF883 family membrane-anchored ribosome-binding protein
MAYEPTRPDIASSPSSSSSVRGEPSERGTSAAASGLGHAATQKAEQARSRAAAGLESAATSVHAGAERAAGAAHTAGDAISSSAQYVRDHDVNEMMEDVMEIVRKNPGVALLGAAAFGFLMGRALTRS